MVVLWRSNEAPGPPDARFFAGPVQGPTGKAGQKNTFMEKHVRVSETIPSQQEMKDIVKAIYDDRQKGANATVKSMHGPDKTKKQLYGGGKPPANTTLFIKPKDFVIVNEKIESSVADANVHGLEITLFGSAVLVTYNPSLPSPFEIKTSGNFKVDVAVGNRAHMGVFAGPGSPTMTSKVVYHLSS